MGDPHDSQLNVLVVDDNKSAALAAALLLRREGHAVDMCNDGGSAIELLQDRPFDLVLTDLRMEPVDGLAVVRAARSCTPPVDAIVVTAFGSVDAAVDAMRLGAIDFLTKPVTADQLLNRVRGFRQSPPTSLALVGDSPQMQHIREQAARLATVRSTVLVTGETGTGRRHLARWLHQNGLDADKPLVLAQPQRELSPESLKGAGTILIVGVDDWSPVAQSHLLRQLASLEAGQPPRVIATGSPNLNARVADGQMAAELYFRLAVLGVQLAPLRERPADVRPLLEHYIRIHGRIYGQATTRPAPAQTEKLARHAWPGNIRELVNLAERAVVLGPAAFEMDVTPPEEDLASPSELAEGFNLPRHLEATERSLLVQAIEQTGGDRPAMCRLLGLERNTLRYKLNKYELLDRT